jgi:hypothetical protein
MKPVIVEDSDVELLTGMEAFESVVRDVDMESTSLACVGVATRAPMLPFSGLMTASLFPHLLRMLEAFRLRSVFLKGEVFLTIRIVLLKFALRSTHHDVFASPRELLDVGTVISQRNRSAIVLEIVADVIQAIKVLIFFWQWKFVFN